MTKYCLKNRSHKVGEDRCLVPSCRSLLGDTEVDDAALKAFDIGEVIYTLNHDRKVADDTIVEADTARSDIEGAVAKAEKAEAKLSRDVERADEDAARTRSVDDPAVLATVAETSLPKQPETLIERVAGGVEEMVASEIAKARTTIESLVERARGKEAEARQSAADAAQHAKTATATAAQAAADAKPHAALPGFSEAARHAAGADYHANASQAAADEAADQAAAASQARQTAEGLAAQSSGQKTAGGLQAVVAEIEKAVAAVEDFAAKAAAALARAKAASSEAGAMGGFFTEALSLWRSLSGH